VLQELPVSIKISRMRDLVSIMLENDLQVQNRFTAKGNIIQGRAWIIDDKILVDLGYDHNVILFDLSNGKRCVN
jgi:hypothetical protein